MIIAAVKRERRITPAAEWLIDNYHLIGEQVRTARKHLPHRYSRELPRLASGPSAGMPRVYDIVLELISHVDGRVDAGGLSSFVSAYQSVTRLKLGELWAVPIMLRLALLENLRRVTARIAAGRRAREQADRWIERMLAGAAIDPTNVVLVLAEMIRENPPLNTPFMAEFAGRLRGEGTSLIFATTWLEQRLSEHGETLEHIFQSASQEQAADQVSVANSINSLRFLSATDWRPFVESLSAVERALRNDPTGIYSKMDFQTRDRYRHAVEELARQTSLTELDVAAMSVELARCESSPKNPTAERNDISHHIGWFLIGRGRRVLERAVHARRTLSGLAEAFHRRFALPIHAGAILIIAIGLTVPLVALASRDAGNAVRLFLLAFALAICFSQVAVAIVHWVTMLVVRPHLLPRMDFASGIPDDCRTLVAVPAMLTDAHEIDGLLEALEIRFLANRDSNLGFALLTDYRDAPSETIPDDEILLKRAASGIEALNSKYGGSTPSPNDQHAWNGSFLLLHRRRKWNPCEGAWIGWERKRGKLDDLNALLRGDADRFDLVTGPRPLLKNIKYVITLDSDTQLPRDVARQLVSTMAHPLNRPRFDARSGQVTDGYSILQPRVGISLASAWRSPFTRLFVSDPGIDPYTRAVSDVYQDVFQEGSYIGKGIYDVDAFVQATRNRFPPNHILSHDLLESAHARSALVSDVMLFEEYPSSYAVDVSRRHRWIRGDWQISPWLLPRVPSEDDSRLPNALSALSRWKILDNLRRSLVAPALFALLILSWTMPHARLAFSLIVPAIVLLPPVLTALAELMRSPADVPVYHHFRFLIQGTARQLAQCFFTLACLPYDAWINVDAIVRTAVRMLITHRKLLEWRTAREAHRHNRGNLAAFYAAMWVLPVAAAIIAACTLLSPSLFPYALPYVAIWLVAPGIACWLSQPIRVAPPPLSADDVIFLRSIARRTWRFFESFVTAGDNWLPPDNFQEDPPNGIAHRTSPTNIGLSLLANLGARDFGFISQSELIERTARTFATLEKLKRHRGHFYNWYDTRTLEPLRPLYVSTVDSGNCAAHLLILAAAFAITPSKRIFDAVTFSGLADAIGLAIESASISQPKLSSVAAALQRLRDDLSDRPNRLSEFITRLQKILLEIRAITASVAPTESGDLAYWLKSAEAQCQQEIDDLTSLAPWASRLTDVHRASPELRDALTRLDRGPSLANIAKLDAAVVALIDDALAEQTGASGDDNAWLQSLRDDCTMSVTRAVARLSDLESLATRSREFAEFDYDFLYDKDRHLLTVGYDVSQHRADSGFYDLLASEARLGSFVGIAMGQLPQEHWFHLGRPITRSAGKPALLSWSGSMFEYLMPLLVMPTFELTLLDETYSAVVKRQIEYGRERSVPWGISESGYYKTDAHLSYQYRAFGVPGLAFKPGLADELVIAPYATAMALMVAPKPAVANLRRLAGEGRLGSYGFYEAIDYTPERLPPGNNSAVIQSYMAHHHVMTLLSLEYVLLDRPMQRRFVSEPAFRATELLLQERVPKVAPIYPYVGEVAEANRTRIEPVENLRIFNTPDTTTPEVHLLSNGRYHVAVTAAGGGYTRWNDLAVTRWHEDPTRDCWGAFAYVRDLDTGEFWSLAHQPTLHRADAYEVVFSQGRAEFRREDGAIISHLEIAVSPEDDIDMRRVTITNRGRKPRNLELTSYAEVVLAPPAADAAHPAFSNLFIQTELDPAHRAIFCTRRPRSASEKHPWMVHMMIVHGDAGSDLSFESARDEFIGRGRTLNNPAAMHRAALSGSHGAVLDPVVAIRTSLSLAPDSAATINLIIGVADSRETIVSLADKYQDPQLADRVFELAWTHSQVVLRQLDASESDMQLYGRLAGSIVFSSPMLRAPASLAARNRRSRSALWGHGISGDLPIVVLRISDAGRMDLVRDLANAHAYWRTKGLAAEIVIWNEDQSGYRQALQDQMIATLSARGQSAMLDKPGGIFIRNTEHISDDDKLLMQAAARAIISDTAGSLADQVRRRPRRDLTVQNLNPPHSRRPEAPAAKQPARMDLIANNATGGFTRDGREYIITTAPDRPTPAPWVNVIANPFFGTVVSESGSAFTWFENSHMCRLTPWSNDWVADPNGEAFYLRDEDTGRYWSPTPLPARGSRPYTTRHGFGYSIFEYSNDGLISELTTYVAVDRAVKFTLIKITNNSGRPRRISLTICLDLVLGDQRSSNAPHIVTEIDTKSGALFARNSYNEDFGDRMFFLDCSQSQRTITGDRVEFLGRNGTPASPACMARVGLSGRVGPNLDPCAAMQVPLDIADGAEQTVVFVFGCGRDRTDARDLATRFRGVAPAQAALSAVWEYWKRVLGTVTVQTPDTALNHLANGWLPYQVLSCRMWARSACYQSGGAFGFRDQLQDALALVHCKPELLRAQLLRCAGRQFLAGDVQHWWHEPGGRGLRTHISDDYLWLPYATSRYVNAIGDTGVLDEEAGFLDGRPVKPDEESYYDLPGISDRRATLYEHCVLAIKNGLRFGEHGLPLIGSGDWNDGMNRVGIHGKGESVWLAFFLYDVLKQFGALAAARNDHTFADLCASQAVTLRDNIRQHGWDGLWYRRAYFDDGTPLGSATNSECSIDLLPQSWAILSNFDDETRPQDALAQLDLKLVTPNPGMIRLLAPPFDRADHDPGYIMGYPPGIRENGGQYTHAAIWAVMAMAKSGNGRRAWQLFDLINPIRHTDTASKLARYKVEPYVVAADVYAHPDHLGRGGWTWYTGSAGWMYQLIIEHLLGLRREGDRLHIKPVWPENWTSFRIAYRFRETTYDLQINRAAAASTTHITLDGSDQPGDTLLLIDDRNKHTAVIES